MPSTAVSSFIARQRATGFQELGGLRVELRLPLAVRDLNPLLTAGAAQNDFVESFRLSAFDKNQISAEIVTRTPALDLPGLGWITRGLLGLDLASRSLRLDFEILQNSFSWPNSPYLILRLPSGMTGGTQATLIRSAVLPKMPDKLQGAVGVVNRDIVINLRVLLDRSGWGALGPALRTVLLSSTQDHLWLNLLLEINQELPSAPAALQGAVKPASKAPNSGPATVMKQIIERHLANGFAEFSGLRCAGQIPIKEELLNELLTEFLQEAVGEKTTGDVAPVGGEESSRPNLVPLLKRVKRTAVRLEEGVMTLHFEVAVE